MLNHYKPEFIPERCAETARRGNHLFSKEATLQ